MNTNSSNPNFSTQTEPLDLSNKTTNTHYFNETTTQTQPLNFSTQTTRTQNPRQTSTQTGPFSTTQPAKEEDFNVNHLYNHFNPTLEDSFMRV